MSVAESLSSIGWNVFTLCLGLTLRLVVMEPLVGASWVTVLFAPLGLSAAAASGVMLCVATLVVFGLTTIAGRAIRSRRTIPPSSRSLFVLPLGALDGTRRASPRDRRTAATQDVVESSDIGPPLSIAVTLTPPHYALPTVRRVRRPARHHRALRDRARRPVVGRRASGGRRHAVGRRMARARRRAAPRPRRGAAWRVLPRARVGAGVPVRARVGHLALRRRLRPRAPSRAVARRRRPRPARAHAQGEWTTKKHRALRTIFWVSFVWGRPRFDRQRCEGPRRESWVA